ncbi:MAG: hypothetical protein ABIY90_14225 [Puia sp.]
MIGYLLLENEHLGEIDFKVIDESMGVVGGDFVPYLAYYKWQKQIQSLYLTKGIANVDDFDFEVMIDGKIVEPMGGLVLQILKSLKKFLWTLQDCLVI